MRHMLGNLSPNYFERTKRYMMLRASRQGTDLTVSGTPPLSLPNSLGKPLKAWSVDLLPYQEGTGDPSPTNVRPIHGTNQISFVTAGQNLLKLDENEMESRGWDRHFPFSIVAGTFTFTCQNQLIASGTAGVRISLRDSEYNVIKNWSNPYTFGANIFSATDTVTEEEARNVDNIAFEFRAAGATWESIASAQIALNVGSTATPYTPYLAPSQTVITLPQTVYTGTIGSEGGESRWASYTATGNETLTEWNLKGASTNIAVRIRNLNGVTSYAFYEDGAKNAMCDMLPQVSNIQMYMRQTNIGICVMNSKEIAIQVDGVTTLEEMSTWLAENKPTFVYKMATPTTFAVPSVTIPTPTGTATTWATAEDGTVESMEVTYVGKV